MVGCTSSLQFLRYSVATYNQRRFMENRIHVYCARTTKKSKQVDNCGMLSVLLARLISSHFHHKTQIPYLVLNLVFLCGTQVPKTYTALQGFIEYVSTSSVDYQVMFHPSFCIHVSFFFKPCLSTSPTLAHPCVESQLRPRHRPRPSSSPSPSLSPVRRTAPPMKDITVARTNDSHLRPMPGITIGCNNGFTVEFQIVSS